MQSAAGKLRNGSAFRITSTAGQVLRSPALRLDTIQEINPNRPTSVAEIDSDGSQHVYLDLGPILGPLFSGNPAAAAAVDSTHIEMWVIGKQLLIDATGYQPLADLNPSYDYGPIAPGLGLIDLAQLGDIGQHDLVALLVGNGIPDPTEMAERLPAVVTDIRVSTSDPFAYIATASYGAIVEVMGSDTEAVAKAVAGPVATALKMNADDVIAFYQRFFESMAADLVITIGDDGALSSIRVSADLSSIFDMLFDPASGLDFGRSSEELADARAAFADTVWTLDALTTFEVDDSITVTRPAGNFEDRTDVAIKYFASVTSD